MDAGWLRVHARGKTGNGSSVKGTWYFPKDTGYLQTAHMLVECGLLLLAKNAGAGVLSPAAAFGDACAKRMDQELGAKLEIVVG